jgi:hypothetical protein
LRKANGQADGIVAPDNKLRPNLEFYALVPDPADRVGQRELQTPITTEAKSEIAKGDDERESDQQECDSSKSSAQTCRGGKRDRHH